MTHSQDTAPKPRPQAHGADSSPHDDPAATLASELVGETENLGLGKRIRLSMNGDDQRTAAARLGMTYHAVRRMSRGNASVDFLRRLCRVYGVDGHWLLTGDGPVWPQERSTHSLRAIPSELLIAEVTRRLGRLLAATDPPPIETALRQGQAALDELRAETPQAP